MVKEIVVKIPHFLPNPLKIQKKLRRASFQVKNVGVDKGATYVYLDPKEKKDPTALVTKWAKRRAWWRKLLFGK